MAKGRSQKESGVDKRVSEPVYPADILAETSLLMASVAAKGAWLWTLNILWRDKTDRLEGTPEEFGRMWGCSEEEAATIINEMRRRNVCDVVGNNGTVTLVSRRLARRDKFRADAAERKRQERLAKDATAAGEPRQDDVTEVSQDCHTDVHAKNPLPSVSSSVSSSVPKKTDLSPPLPPSANSAPDEPASDGLGGIHSEEGSNGKNNSTTKDTQNGGKGKHQKRKLRDACATDWKHGIFEFVMKQMPKEWRGMISPTGAPDSYGRYCRLMQCAPARVLATVLDLKRGKKQPAAPLQAMQWLFSRLNEGKSPADDHYDEAKKRLRKARKE